MSIPVSDIRPYRADRRRSSPNHGARNAQNIKLLVLHATAAATDTSAENAMANSAHEAAAHLNVRRDGSTTRMVDDTRRAWHAGASSWPGVGDVNSESLGVEIGNRNDGIEPYTAEQYETVADIVRHYLGQGLRREGVVGHHHVAPGRKTDPLGWDWGRMWRLVDNDVLGVEVDLPEIEMVDSTWEPMELSSFEPVAVLRSPARAAVAATAEPDEPLRDWLCRITGWVMDEQALTGRLPWWLPPSLARKALRHVFGCAP